jgi:hypothetical protein
MIAFIMFIFGSGLQSLCFDWFAMVPDEQALVLADTMWCFAAAVASCLG